MNKDKLIMFPDGCIKGKFVKRIKRFTVEVECDGEIVSAHSNNTGSMMGLTNIGSSVLLSRAQNPKRKLAYTLELCSQCNTWVGVNTLSPNRLVRAAFSKGLLHWAQGYTKFTSEAPYGDSRFDALIEESGKPRLWVECKNVTLVEDGSVAYFPDAVSDRAKKHLQHMIGLCEKGERAAFFYCIQREDAECFAPADFVDMSYSKLFYEAIEKGVEVYPYKISVDERGLGLGKLLPIRDQAF